MTAKLYKMVFAEGETFFVGHGPVQLVELPLPADQVCARCKEMVAVPTMLTDGTCKRCTGEVSV